LKGARDRQASIAFFMSPLPASFLVMIRTLPLAGSGSGMSMPLSRMHWANFLPCSAGSVEAVGEAEVVGVPEARVTEATPVVLGWFPQAATRVISAAASNARLMLPTVAGPHRSRLGAA
jgi:hypothetical protein